jgi:hypothetical protein
VLSRITERLATYTKLDGSTAFTNVQTGVAPAAADNTAKLVTAAWTNTRIGAYLASYQTWDVTWQWVANNYATIASLAATNTNIANNSATYAWVSANFIDNNEITAYATNANLGNYALTSTVDSHVSNLVNHTNTTDANRAAWVSANFIDTNEISAYATIGYVNGTFATPQAAVDIVLGNNNWVIASFDGKGAGDAAVANNNSGYIQPNFATYSWVTNNFVGKSGDTLTVAYGNFTESLTARAITCATMRATEDKFFEIEHPLKPDHLLRHASLEGPEAGVYYRGKGEVIDAPVTITLPYYFTAIVDETNATVHLTPISDGSAFGHLAASEVIGGRFTVYSTTPNQRFHWRVEASRHDIIIEERKPS